MMDTVESEFPAGIEHKSAAGEAQSLEEIGEAFEAFMAEAAEERKRHAQELEAERKRIDEIEKKANRPGAPPSEGSLVAGGVVDQPTVERFHKALGQIAKSVRDFGPADFSEMKAMSVGSDPSGGYFVQTQISNRWTKAIRDQSPMRRIARVEQISVGDAWEEPIDMDDLGAEWVDETSPRLETSTPQGGVFKVPLHELHAMPKVTQRLLEDSEIDIGRWLEGKMIDRFARTEGQAFVLGDGINKPRGFLTYEARREKDFVRPWGTWQTLPSGSATDIISDALKAMAWSLKAPYRQGACWLMNSETAMQIDRLKDGNGQYVWRTGMTAGAPNTLLGYPVEIDENMPNIAAGSLPLAFGNFREAYVIVDRPGIKTRPDPFTQKPFVLFQAWKRTGGGAANFHALKLMQIAAN